jgi:hypothetical protein
MIVGGRSDHFDVTEEWVESWDKGVNQHNDTFKATLLVRNLRHLAGSAPSRSSVADSSSNSLLQASSQPKTAEQLTSESRLHRVESMNILLSHKSIAPKVQKHARLPRCVKYLFPEANLRSLNAFSRKFPLLYVDKLWAKVCLLVPSRRTNIK